MFSTKGPTSPLWKSLALDFQGRILFAQVRDTQEMVVNEFNIDTYPTLILLPGGSAPGIVYKGDMKRDPMFQFLSEYAATISPSATSSPTLRPKRQEPTGLCISDCAENSWLYTQKDYWNFWVGGELFC